MTCKKFLKKSRVCFFGITLGMTLLLSACDDVKVGRPQTNPEYDSIASKRESKSIFGGDGLLSFSSKGSSSEGGGGIGVNSFLWRASLDTISFMPIASADPFGGVILTDWYSPPESPDERVKANIFIMGTQLRSDGIRATVFRQTFEDGRGWMDATVTPETVTKLENAILDKARELRTRQAAQEGEG